MTNILQFEFRSAKAVTVCRPIVSGFRSSSEPLCLRDLPRLIGNVSFVFIVLESDVLDVHVELYLSFDFAVWWHGH